MFDNMRDWLDALSVVSSFITLYGFWRGYSRRRQSRRERFRSFKGFGMEWTAYDRDDDSRS